MHGRSQKYNAGTCWLPYCLAPCCWVPAEPLRHVISSRKGSLRVKYSLSFISFNFSRVALQQRLDFKGPSISEPPMPNVLTSDNIEELVEKAHKEMKNISEWTKINKLRINSQKKLNAVHDTCK